MSKTISNPNPDTDPDPDTDPNPNAPLPPVSPTLLYRQYPLKLPVTAKYPPLTVTLTPIGGFCNLVQCDGSPRATGPKQNRRVQGIRCQAPITEPPNVNPNTKPPQSRTMPTKPETRFYLDLNIAIEPCSYLYRIRLSLLKQIIVRRSAFCRASYLV